LVFSQALTIDSRIADNAPPRVIRGVAVKTTAEYLQRVSEEAGQEL
jgi:hypothetical protein